MARKKYKNEAWVTTQFKRWIELEAKRSIYPHWICKLSDRFHSGIPDFVVILNRKLAFFEIKAWNQHPTPIQTHVMQTIINAGIDCYVWQADLNDDNTIRTRTTPGGKQYFQTIQNKKGKTCNHQ